MTGSFPKRFWVVVVKIYIFQVAFTKTERVKLIFYWVLIILIAEEPLDVKVFTRVHGFLLHHIFFCQMLSVCGKKNECLKISQCGLGKQYVKYEHVFKKSVAE